MATTRSKRVSDEKTETVQRKIFFYEIQAGRGQDGQPEIFDPEPALSFIDSLPYNANPGGRYLEGENKSFYSANIISTKAPQKVIYYLTRRSDLPEIEQGGAFSSLKIGPTAGLGEKIHVMFFGRYVAADFNFHGPRATTFPRYLQLKAKGFVPPMGGLVFSLLLNGEASEKLNRLEGLTFARMKMSRTALGIADQADESMAEMLRQNIESTNSDELELTLRVSRPKKGQLRRFLSPSILNLLKGLADKPDTYQAFDRLEARGIGRISKEPELVDILQDELISQATMIKTSSRSRSIESGQAFSAIASAFRKVKSEIADGNKVY